MCTLQCVRKKTFTFFLLPENLKIPDEIRKGFQRNRPNTFYLLGPGSERKKELEIKYLLKENWFGRISFFCSPTESTMWPPKRLRNHWKTTFCGIGGTASRNLIKLVEYWWFCSTLYGKAHKSLQTTMFISILWYTFAMLENLWNPYENLLSRKLRNPVTEPL